MSNQKGISKKKRNEAYAKAKLFLYSPEGESFFGRGLAELLRRIDRTGSMRRAGMEMEMSYSKCWKIIRRAERCLGFSLLDGSAGGSGGGGSVLTEKGRDLLERFDRAQEELDQMTEKIYKEHFSNQ